MSRSLFVRLTLIAAPSILLGAASAIALVEWHDPQQAVGSWTTDVIGKGERQSLVAAAFEARHQLFGLSPDEAVYFYQRYDNEGRALRSDCNYRVNGSLLPGRWWSLTAYGEDGYLIQSNDDRHSVTSSTVTVGNGGWHADIVGTKTENTGSISSSGAGSFYLLLRIYQAPELGAQQWVRRLPSINRIRCGEQL
jgi:hypothetical protein